jgi:hypothetical protein
MKCPNLGGWLTSNCKAVDDYAPKSEEVKKLCKTDEYKKCSFYLGMVFNRELFTGPALNK